LRQLSGLPHTRSGSEGGNVFECFLKTDRLSDSERVRQGVWLVAKETLAIHGADQRSVIRHLPRRVRFGGLRFANPPYAFWCAVC
jgi:hypothetical protein